jgi:hypothetical protein
MKAMKFLPYAALLLTSAAFAAPKSCAPKKAEAPTCPLEGEPLACGYDAAYNAPAAIGFSCNDTHFFADGSFTYWYAGQEGMHIASNGVLSPPMVYFPGKVTTVFQLSGYKPGFKAGFGVVTDNEWVVHAEYTWYRGTHTANTGSPPASQSLTAGTATALSGTPVWVVDDWFLQGTTDGQALSGSNVSSSWRLAMDLIDVTAGRPFYQGKRVVVSPFGGIRSALIRQKMNVSFIEDPRLYPLNPQPIKSNNKSNSWSIGPRFGADVDVLLNGGFRLEGELAASLLFTQYTTVKHTEDPAASTFNQGPLKASWRNYNCLRPVVELGLGIGWGQYFSDDQYHADVSLDYDFSLFWEQNMMRRLIDDTLTGTGPASSNLYFHGLTLTVRFDF